MKELLVIDGDDVLFNENTAIRLFVNREYGFNHTEEDYLVPGSFIGYWERIWNVPAEQAEEIYEAFIASPDKANLPPVKDGPEAIKRLQKKYELAFLTSRGTELRDITNASLDTYYPGAFADRHFVSEWDMTKALICKELGAKALIDYTIENTGPAAKLGIGAVLFGDYGWSQVETLPPGVIRCSDWQTVTELFEV